MLAIVLRRSWLCLLMVLLPTLLSAKEDDYPFANLEGKEAAAKMILPKGFSVTCCAQEPEVKQPIAMALDDRGRLWVAEAYTYPIRAEEGKGTDRILIFEDTDGDNKFDKRTVFLENLNLVSGLEVGFGGVYIGAAPYLLFVPDKNHDDKPDGPPEILLDGWAFQDTHETLNTFIWGPDGWLYGCHGVFTHSNVGKPGASDDERQRLNAAIWRYHPTEKKFEVFIEGTSNPWGVDFNDYGESFLTACVIPHLYHLFPGAHYERQAGNHFNPFVFDDIKTIADHRHWVGATPHAGNQRSDQAGGGHAHCGAMIYLGGSWPAEYRNQIFMNNIHGQRINMDTLKAEGSGYVGSHGPDFILTQDKWSQILNMRYGPDGQAYMIDWYDLNACHHREANAHDRSNGRIFKVIYNDAKPVKVDLAKATDDELVQMQLNTNDWYVRHARRILQERGANPKVHAALVKMFDEQKDDTRRLRAIWALYVTGGLTDAVVDKMLSDESPYVRSWGTRLLTENPGSKIATNLQERLVKLAASDPSPIVRRWVASAAQRVPHELSAKLLGGLLAHAEDAGDHNLPLMYWWAAEKLIDHDPKAAIAAAANGKFPMVLEYTVRKIASSGEPKALNELVAAMGSFKEEVQVTVADGMNQALKGRRKLQKPEGFTKLFETLLKSQNAELRTQITLLALTFREPEAAKLLRAKAADKNVAAPERIQAIDALVVVKDGEMVPLLIDLLQDKGVRGAALRGLSSYDDAKIPTAILAIYKDLASEERRSALNTLSSRLQYAMELMKKIAAKEVPTSDISADVMRQLQNHKNDELDQQIDSLVGKVTASSKDKKRQIADFTRLIQDDDMVDPDPALGRAVYQKTCAQCHTLFGKGGNVGPELTGSNRANLEYILSNIVDPSAIISKEYQVSKFALSSGELILGIIKEKTDQVYTVQTTDALKTINKDDLDEEPVLSELSMMPEDMLKTLKQHEVRSLIAYLASPVQIPMLATPENTKSIFNGTDLTGWYDDLGLWRVENGELIGHGKGLKKNVFLKSDVTAANFRLKLKAKLVNDAGNTGIQFRSLVDDRGKMKGYQADIGKGWWGTLYEEELRGSLTKTLPPEAVIHENDWNDYEILAVGDHVTLKLNGVVTVDMEDNPGAKRGIFALQLHAGNDTEIHFKDIEIEILP